MKISRQGLATAILLLNIILLDAGEETESGQFEASYTNEWAVRINGGDEIVARSLAEEVGYQFVEKIPNLPETFVFRHLIVSERSRRSAEHHTKTLNGHHKVTWAAQQKLKQRVKRNIIANDEDWCEEWYLNSEDCASTIPRDPKDSLSHVVGLNVLPVWQMGITGKDVVIVVPDDGIEHNHTDIKDNYWPQASFDINGNDPDPFPRYDITNENRHGTRCAGEIVMAANNSKCGVGIAYGAKLGGVRMLDGRITDVTEAKSLSLGLDIWDIVSSSWGPNDDGKTLEGPDKLARTALEEGVKMGRDGKGVIYVWASGNGGKMADNCNMDGYASSIYTISISSASENGKSPWYAERCSSTMATTFSSGDTSEKSVMTTDLHDKCTLKHSGTSASAPLAAGIVAFALEVNPELTWRDVQHILAWTSEYAPLSSDIGDWKTNGVGIKYHDSFGFGLINAEAVVEMADPVLWQRVPEKNECEIEILNNQEQIGNVVTVVISAENCQEKTKFLEHVQLYLTIEYPNRGDLQIYLISPKGTESTLLDLRPYDRSEDGFDDWPFMTVHYWGESPTSDNETNWQVEIRSQDYNIEDRVKVKSGRLVLHGTKEQPHYQKNARRTYRYLEENYSDKIGNHISMADIKSEYETSDFSEYFYSDGTDEFQDGLKTNLIIEYFFNLFLKRKNNIKRRISKQ